MHIYVVICFSNSIFCKKKNYTSKEVSNLSYDGVQRIFSEKMEKKTSEPFESSQLNQRSFEYFFG